jgi:hypothetical protein
MYYSDLLNSPTATNSICSSTEAAYNPHPTNVLCVLHVLFDCQQTRFWHVIGRFRPTAGMARDLFVTAVVQLCPKSICYCQSWFSIITNTFRRWPLNIGIMSTNGYKTKPFEQQPDNDELNLLCIQSVQSLLGDYSHYWNHGRRSWIDSTENLK